VRYASGLKTSPNKQKKEFVYTESGFDSDQLDPNATFDLKGYTSEFTDL
jgi:hypothetical protein